MDIVDARVERILNAAGDAPSVLNTQPWRVATSDRTVTLRADPSRQLRHSDPHGREMLISCGAFLFNARVAARRESLTAVVTVLPDPEDDLLVAQITLEPGDDPGDDELELSVAIEHRTTSRVPFEDRPLPADVLVAIQRAAYAEGASMRTIQPSDPSRPEVLALVRRAEAVAAEDMAARDEEAAWTATWPGRDDGIPAHLLGRAPSNPDAPVRRFNASRGREPFERHSTLAVLTTPGDSPRDWVAAGQALEHALLVATTHFVHASFATTVLENPTTRHDLRQALSLHAYPQMLMRLGTSPQAERTPRRTRPRHDAVRPWTPWRNRPTA
ncbi:Acg family FMN-binding oxidoreductase [Promicromonospora sp. NPDC050880]|uniref:Acg family FMN-binding oxidoreductase n=1 Tax=Promicromonospora sp. NPDC050880 TaxID=3364406 RepID=UPI0037B4A88C